jgi:hypothetical protein
MPSPSYPRDRSPIGKFSAPRPSRLRRVLMATKDIVTCLLCCCPLKRDRSSSDMISPTYSECASLRSFGAPSLISYDSDSDFGGCFRRPRKVNIYTGRVSQFHWNTQKKKKNLIHFQLSLRPALRAILVSGSACRGLLISGLTSGSVRGPSGFRLSGVRVLRGSGLKLPLQISKKKKNTTLA